MGHWHKIFPRSKFNDLPVNLKSGLPRVWQKKIPWLFPDSKHKFQSMSPYIHCGDFCDIFKAQKITLFINRCFNAVVLKIGQHKRTFLTSWKLSISCAEHYAKQEKFWKKSFGKWYLNENLIQDFVLVQISFAKWWKICIDRHHRWNSLTFPWLW